MSAPPRSCQQRPLANEEEAMTPQQLRLVKNFWIKAENKLDAAIPHMYEKFFDMTPEAKELFKGPIHEQQKQFAGMLGGVIKLTRSSHLWPVSAFTGQAVIPGLDNLRKRHERVGVRPEHFQTMKSALMISFSEVFPEDFTPEVREALSVVFDVLAHSLTDTKSVEKACDSEQARFFNRQPVNEGVSFAEYMGVSAAAPSAVASQTR
ncbi:MAG: globin domain-containing protein [Alphaproteobacteria bacterium]